MFLANVFLSIFSNCVSYRHSCSSIFGKNDQKRLCLRSNVEIKKKKRFCVTDIWRYQKRELVNPNVDIRQSAKDENGIISCPFLWPNHMRSMN